MRLFIQIIDNIYIYTAAHACMTGRCQEETPNKKKGEKKVSGAAEKGNAAVAGAQCRRWPITCTGREVSTFVTRWFLRKTAVFRHNKRRLPTTMTLYIIIRTHHTDRFRLKTGIWIISQRPRTSYISQFSGYYIISPPFGVSRIDKH